MELFAGRPVILAMRVGVRVAIGLVAVTTAVAALVITRDALISAPLPGPSRSQAQPVGSTGQFVFYANSGHVTQGVKYGFRLYSHCGLDYPTGPDFDGSFWRSVGPGDDGSGNPPAGFANPYDTGTMTLLSAQLAEYHGWSGATMRFTRQGTTVTSGFCS